MRLYTSSLSKVYLITTGLLSLPSTFPVSALIKSYKNLESITIRSSEGKSKRLLCESRRRIHARMIMIRTREQDHHSIIDKAHRALKATDERSDAFYMTRKNTLIVTANSLCSSASFLRLGSPTVILSHQSKDFFRIRRRSEISNVNKLMLLRIMNSYPLILSRYQTSNKLKRLRT